MNIAYQCYLIYWQNTFYQGPFTPMLCLVELSHMKCMMNNLYLSTIQLRPRCISEYCKLSDCWPGWGYRSLYTPVCQKLCKDKDMGGLSRIVGAFKRLTCLLFL